jgi:hypothetical protein
LYLIETGLRKHRRRIPLTDEVRLRAIRHRY